MDVTMTDSAATRINALTQSGENQGKALRLAVEAGGCSGFEYKFSFTDAPTEQDRLFTHNDARLVVDGVSLGLLGGATLDYKESLMGSQFQIVNPNAASGCGCGNSFSV